MSDDKRGEGFGPHGSGPPIADDHHWERRPDGTRVLRRNDTTNEQHLANLDGLIDDLPSYEGASVRWARDQVVELRRERDALLQQISDARGAVSVMDSPPRYLLRALKMDDEVSL